MGAGHRPVHDDDQVPLARRLFVGASAFVLVAFVLAQVVMGAKSNAPTEQAKKLMGQIRAEAIDAPLTPTQLAWKLETEEGVRTLADLPRDTVIFLNFWATWCEPCRDELPSMLQLRGGLEDRRFMMVAVSYDEEWSQIREFFRSWFGRMPSNRELLLLRDPHLEEGTTLRETFGTTQIPDSYVIYNGRVLARFVNARNWADTSIYNYFLLISPEFGASP